MHQCGLYIYTHIYIYMVIITRSITTMIGNRWLQKFLDPTKKPKIKLLPSIATC